MWKRVVSSWPDWFLLELSCSKRLSNDAQKVGHVISKPLQLVWSTGVELVLSLQLGLVWNLDTPFFYSKKETWKSFMIRFHWAGNLVSEPAHPGWFVSPHLVPLFLSFEKRLLSVCDLLIQLRARTLKLFKLLLQITQGSLPFCALGLSTVFQTFTGSKNKRKTTHGERLSERRACH